MNIRSSHVHAPERRSFPGQEFADRITDILNKAGKDEIPDDPGPRAASNRDTRIAEQVVRDAAAGDQTAVLRVMKDVRPVTDIPETAIKTPSSAAITRYHIRRLLAAEGKLRSVAQHRPARPGRNVIIKREASLSSPPLEYDQPKRGSEWDFFSADEAINTILSAYKLTPVRAWSVKQCWKVDWRSAVAGGPPFFDRTEVEAIIAVLRLGEMGLLLRIRQCTCGEWFFAQFAHRKFHSLECQQHTFRSDPEWKKKRAKRMQFLRAQEKEKLRKQPWAKKKK